MFVPVRALNSLSIYPSASEQHLRAPFHELVHTVLRGFDIKMSEQDARAMAKDPRIESITANHIIGNVWGNQ